MPTATREIQLAARPHGEPKPTDFRLVAVELPDPGPGEILVHNTYMSVDPYMRGRMNDVKSYVPPFQLDAPLDGGAGGRAAAPRAPADGGAVGEVQASGADGFAPGDVVLHRLGWRDHAVLAAEHARKVDAG